MTFLRRPLLRLALAGIAIAALALPLVALADSLSGWQQKLPVLLNDWNPVTQTNDIAVAGGLNAVSFTDATHGWAVGVRASGVSPQNAPTSMVGLVGTTSDGGTTWTSTWGGTVPAVELDAVCALSSTNVWAVGASGTVAHFDGTSWTTQQLWTSSFHLRGVAFTDANNGWAVGDGGGLARYSSGTWTVVTQPVRTGKSLRALASVGTAACIAVGDAGAAFRLDSAATTITVGTSSNLYGITFADATHGWAVGDGPTVVRTGDGGATWTAAGKLPIPTGFAAVNLPARAVAFTDALTGVVVGRYQMVWRTLDGGVSWTAAPITIPNTFNDNELLGVALSPGTAASASVVAVGRAPLLQLNSHDDQPVAYLGSWTNMTAPSASSNAAPLYGDFAIITVSASARPGSGGLASVSYVLDGAAIPVTIPASGQATSVPLPKISGARAHTLTFWSTDALGNTSSHQTVAFTIMARPSSAGYPTTPVTPSTAIHGRSFSTYGYVVYHAAGTSPVTLYFYRYRSGRWLLYKAIGAPVSTIAVQGTPFSKYARSLSLPYAGKWRVRALHKVGTASRYSAYRTFTVR